jgi:hypothetical protein
VADVARAYLARLVAGALDDLASSKPDIAIRHTSPVRTEITVKSSEGRRRVFTVALITHREEP